TGSSVLAATSDVNSFAPGGSSADKDSGSTTSSAKKTPKNKSAVPPSFHSRTFSDAFVFQVVFPKLAQHNWYLNNTTEQNEKAVKEYFKSKDPRKLFQALVRNDVQYFVPLRVMLESLDSALAATMSGGDVAGEPRRRQDTNSSSSGVRRRSSVSPGGGRRSGFSSRGLANSSRKEQNQKPPSQRKLLEQEMELIS
ncbi:unnamed protein product, partial [Amoebophrya sp. A120]